MRTTIKILAQLGFLFLFCSSAMADALVTIPTRDNVKLSYWWMPRDNAKATLILFSGGEGGIGYKDGKPQSENFLIRSSEYFATGNPNAMFNVALLGNPSDKPKLDYRFRVTAEHIKDIEMIVANIRARSTLPIWFVGTSEGTISPTAAAIEMGSRINGVVLTAAFTTFKNASSVPSQRIQKIQVPVLVVDHEKDSCEWTKPSEVKYIMDRLPETIVKKSIFLTGGGDPTGDPCQALHWHGFINYEAPAAKVITDWILNPKP
jgi:hypothetical protein